jgi:hypothetical protein
MNTEPPLILVLVLAVAVMVMLRLHPASGASSFVCRS